MPTHPLLPSPHVARREILKQAAAAVAWLAPGVSALAAASNTTDAATDLRNRAVALLNANLAVDMHSHLGGTTARRPVNDFDQLKASGFSAVCMSLVSDSPVLALKNGKLFAKRQPEPGELHRHTLERLDFADRAIADNGFKRVTTLADLQQSKASKTVGIILATEGPDFLEGKLEHLDVLYARGVRHFQLVHYRANNGLGDIQTEPTVNHGTTPFGLDVVRACNRLGMVVDVAHATYDAVKQIAEVCSTPLILSHTEFDTQPARLSRRINSEHAKLVAKTGGVVGIWTNARNLPNAAAYAQGVARMADVVGVDHVGIGTDKNGLPNPMMASYADFPDMVADMLKYFKEDELAKILGGNYLRVFDLATKTQVIG